jgi:RecA/RadA recombinase
MVQGFINTECYILNAILYNGDILGGMPTGRRIMLAGEKSTAKSYFCNFLIKSFLDKDEKNVILLFESEGSSVYEMATSHNLDMDRIIVYPVGTIEAFDSQLVNVLDFIKDSREKKTGPHDNNFMVVLDSLGMLSTEKSITDAKEGKVSVDLSKAKRALSCFRNISLDLTLLNIPMLIANHVHSTLDQYNPRAVSGGSGSEFASDVVIILSKTKDVEKTGSDKRQVGIKIKARVTKSRYMKDNIDVEIPIHFEKGLYKYASLIEKAALHGIIKLKDGGSKGKIIILKDGSEVTLKEFRSKISEYLSGNLLEEIRVAIKSEFGYGKKELSIQDDFSGTDDTETDQTEE